MNLRDWRKEKGWTQGDLADKIGEPRPTFQKWEAGVSPTPPAAQAKIRKLGFSGDFPEPGRPITLEDLESIREEIRTQAAWVREELRKENVALAAALQEALRRLEALQGNPTA